MTDFGWSWQKSKQTAAVAESDEARENKRAIHELQIDIAVGKAERKSLLQRVHMDPDVHEAMRLRAWGKAGRVFGTPNPDAPGGYDVEYPDGWPSEIGDVKAHLASEISAMGFALESDEQ